MIDHHQSSSTTIVMTLQQAEAELQKEQQRILELAHLNSIHNNSFSSRNNNHNNNDTTTNPTKTISSDDEQQQKQRIRDLKQRIDEANSKNKQEKEIFNNLQQSLHSSSSSVSLMMNSSNSSNNVYVSPTDHIHETLHEILPQKLLEQHQSLFNSLLYDEFDRVVKTDIQQHLQPRIDKFSKKIEKYYEKRIEIEIVNREKEVRTRRIFPHEDQERVVLLQQWNQETKTLVENIRNTVSSLNLRGSELQHTLGSKREEYQRALKEYEEVKIENGVLSSPPPNRRKQKMVVQQNDDQEEEEEDDDDTAEILFKLQNQFSEMQQDLHSRPSHKETGLERLREQIITLSQELMETKNALNEEAMKDEENEQEEEETENGTNNKTTKRKSTLQLQKEIREVKKLQKMKLELEEKIPQLRRDIERDQKTITDVLKIDANRIKLEKRQKKLQDEINDLRDELYEE